MSYLTLEQEQKISSLYLQENNPKRLVYRVLKSLNFNLNREAKTSEVEDGIYDLYSGGYLLLTEEFKTNLRNVKNTLFELQNINYVTSTLQTEVKARYKATTNKDKRPFTHHEYNNRYWKVIK